MANIDNMDIWNAFSSTDPTQTKSFSRPGGFKGTAIKPIYSYKRMTEKFGPCGHGWRIFPPEFTIHDGVEGTVLVICNVNVGYQVGGEWCSVPGVGGDFLIASGKYGLRADDEAHKKAFTDAIGNALKHLGMSADVHMGEFDGDKYTHEPKSPPARASSPPRAGQPPDQDADKSGAPSSEIAITAIKAFAKIDDLNAWWNRQAVQGRMALMKSMAPAEYEKVMAALTAKSTELMDAAD